MAKFKDLCKLATHAVFQVFGLGLRHLPRGELKHFLTAKKPTTRLIRLIRVIIKCKWAEHSPEQLEDGHVVLAETFIGLTGPNNVTDEGWPILWPLILEDLYKDHVQLAQVYTIFL